MESLVFSIGDTTISGEFAGRSRLEGQALHMVGVIRFELTDAFRDPLDIGTFLPERYARLNEKIMTAVADALDAAGDVIVDTAEIVRNVMEQIENEIGNVDQFLRDYIYRRALRGVVRQNKFWASGLERKDLRELPGGTPYSIGDQWRGTFSATVNSDPSESQFTQ